MKKWWLWFILSGIWILVAIFNVLDKRSSVTIGFNIFVVVFFAVLGITQYFCDKKGEKGKKLFNQICMGATAIVVLLIILIIVGVFNGNSQKEPSVVKNYEVTDSELAELYFENDMLVTIVQYYEMSDGTWKTDDYTYQYRLEVTGRMNNAAKDSTFVFLSNIKDITFEQAWKASGLSSNMDDYFKEEDAKFVGMKQIILIYEKNTSTCQNETINILLTNSTKYNIMQRRRKCQWHINVLMI